MRPNDGYVGRFCKQYLDRLDAIKVFFTKSAHITVFRARLQKNS